MNKEKTKRQSLKEVAELKEKRNANGDKLKKEKADHKQTEFALRQSEKKFMGLINDINDGVINTDTRGVITFVNPGLVEIYGYDDPSELIGKSIMDFIVDEEKQENLKLYGTSMRTGKFPDIVESRIIGKDGKIRIIEAKPVPFFQNGDIVGSTSIVRNITPRKLAEEELRRHKEHLEELVGQRSAELKASEFRFRTIFDNVPVSIWEEDWGEVYDLIADLKQKGIEDYEEYFNNHPAFVQKALEAVKVVDVNDQTLKMFGAKDKKEMLSSLKVVFSTKDTLPGFISEIAALAQEKYFFETEMALRTVSKEEIIVHLTMIFPEQNEPFNRVLVTLTEITELKKFEESLKNKTKELTRSNEDLQQFAYVASHDLQEPLRKIANFSELLADRYRGKLDDKADIFIGYIVDGATRMKTLINDLLAYSRVGSRGDPTQLINTKTVVKQVLSNLSTSIKESGAIIRFKYLPQVHADPSQLSQLFQNLISNAIKFRSEENPKIHIDAQQQNGEWIFSVKDNGIGIDSEFNDRIFIIFQRLHTMAEYPGTGIGLALCRKIVERHGGRIWIESQPGKGSAFYFTIPTRRGSNHV